DVLFEVLAPLRPRYRHDIRPLRQHPRQRELRRLATLLRRDLPDALDEAHVLSEVLLAEARELPAPVVLGQVFRLLEVARQEAAPERAVGDEADAQLPARGQNLRLHVARPERVFALQSGDGVYGRRAPDRLGRSL